MYVLKNLYNDDWFYIHFHDIYYLDESEIDSDQEEQESSEDILQDNTENTETEIASVTDALPESEINSNLHNIYVALVLFLFFYILFNFKTVIHRSFYNNTKEM